MDTRIRVEVGGESGIWEEVQLTLQQRCGWGTNPSAVKNPPMTYSQPSVTTAPPNLVPCVWTRPSTWIGAVLWFSLLKITHTSRAAQF